MTQRRAKFQVFVSSTYTDLHEERAAVVWEILKARHIPAGMETFPATDDRGWQIIQRTIDDSDYYVVLLAGRYGSVDPSTGMSWTEREYEYARLKGIPVLAFVRDAASITADKMESGPNAGLLDAFRQRLESTHLCKKWRSAEDLRSEVSASLLRAIQDAQDDGRAPAGWVRGDSIPADALEEITRLSKENAQLRKGTALPPGEVERLVQGDDVFKLNVEFRVSEPGVDYRPGKARTLSRTCTPSWDQIFGAFAPNLAPSATEQEMRRDICKLLKSEFGPTLPPKAREHISSAAISDSDYQTIKVQFLALGLIQVLTEWKTVAKSHRGTEEKERRMIQITEAGRQHLFAVKAIRRPD